MQEPQLQAILPLPPAQPPSSATRIYDINYASLVSTVKDIGEALDNRKKNLASVKYRLEKLDNSIPKNHTALAQAHDPSGAVVNGYINQSQSTINFIEDIL